MQFIFQDTTNVPPDTKQNLHQATCFGKYFQETYHLFFVSCEEANLLQGISIIPHLKSEMVYPVFLFVRYVYIIFVDIAFEFHFFKIHCYLSEKKEI